MIKEVFDPMELQKYVIKLIKHQKVTKSGLVTNECVSYHYLETKSLSTAIKKAIKLEKKAEHEKNVKIVETELYKFTL